MQKELTTFLIAILVAIYPVVLFAQNSTDDLKERADSLYENYNEKEALEIYRQLLEQQPKDFETLWRTSFLYSRVGNRLDSKDQQEEYFNRAIELAKRSLDVDSTHTQSNFVMAVAMGRKALISGARSRVAASREIKKYADRALEYDPKNEGAWHVLGRWHFKVANLSWFERAAANTLFGGLPGDASNEKAAEYIEKAIDLNDKYLMYYYDLARIYDEIGREAEAIEACKIALDKPELTVDDDKIKQDCRELIEDLS